MAMLKMRTTSTFNVSSALTALRVINKARQCAKRGDHEGMLNYAEQAYIECACTPAQGSDQSVSGIAAYSVSTQVQGLYLTAHKGDCDAFVSHTSHLDYDIRELVNSIQWERKWGCLVYA